MRCNAIFTKISFFWFVFGLAIFSSASFFAHTAYALQGEVTIYAFVPEKTATTTFSFGSGGDFTFTAVDNTQINFTLPTDFYSENLELKIFQYDQATFESQKPPPSGKSFVGKAYDFNFFTTTGGSVSTLSSAPTLVMHYLDSDVSGLNESTIAPYRRGTNDSSWSLISGSTVNTAANTITFATSTFSSFGIFGAPACSDGVDNDGDGKTDYSADPGCSSTSDNNETDPAPAPTPTPSSGGGGGGGGGSGFHVVIVKGPVCTEEWTCTEWSACEDGTQSRICTDSNACGTEENRPEEERACETGSGCTESWICEDWSECSGETQSRNCIDISGCGTFEDQPELSRSCGAGEGQPQLPITGLIAGGISQYAPYIAGIIILAAIITALILRKKGSRKRTKK